MLQVKKLLNEQRKYTVTYIREVKTYLISSEAMTDDCRPRREGSEYLLWMDDRYTLCEFETIFTPMIDSDLGVKGLDCETVEGLPTFKIEPGENEVRLFLNGNNSILFLNYKKKPNKKCSVGSITFYLCGDKVVAIESGNTCIE